MGGPHVVMIVANDVTNDTRVLKEAIALGTAGYRVTLLGVSASGRTAIDTIEGGVVMIRVPGRFLLRDERNRRRRHRRDRRLLGERVELAETARTAARLADLRAETGRAQAKRRAGAIGPASYQAGRAIRVVKGRGWRLAHGARSVAGWLTELESRQASGFWQWWDTWLPARTELVNWRSVIPEADDYEAIFADLLAQLRPDVLHAHDMHVIGVACRAAGVAELRGRTVKVVYDAHEYVAGLSQYGGRTPRMIAAWAQHERTYIRSVDRVITVSPAIARTLHKQYRLDREPTVVINSPQLAAEGGEVTDIRTAVGLADDVPLLVYSGGITRARGVETAIAALPLLPDVHLAVVCVPHTRTRPVDELRALAAEVGVKDRVHYLNPVQTADVVSFLRTADIGLIPILRYPSHEMALPNKVFEYTFAGLPVVTSDMPTLQEFVDKTGIGEVFTAEDPDDLAAAVQRVLKDPASYRHRVADPGLRSEMSWETQAAHLRDLYADLIGPPEPVEDTSPRLVVGPIGSDAARRWLRELGVGFIRPQLAPSDLDGITHLLIEDWQSILGSEDLVSDLPLLAAARIKHAVVVYGRVDREQVRRRARAYGGTVFATDRVIAEAVDGARWLPAGPEGTEILRGFLAD
ncbi:glycosyltransferase family 4 protein [Kribbella kalugense]|uniref:Glycosyltransferase involved in cell wall biosynthesis n=1 Tax=Kribbella kalugense TaxID=2512221 RepID=A0A4R7ZUE9_9ACTN|nr:glycosyltransferase family 4 protein [Kribbella kalugense]TDW21482.1 glycosyltransferase involved in cell wall biosynthesis [Kribbella kalugense]